MATKPISEINTDYKDKYGFNDNLENVIDTGSGLNEDIIRKICTYKNNDQWLKEKRLAAYKIFKSKHLPLWGADLSEIDLDSIHYFVRASKKQSKKWEDVPETIKNTFTKLGIPQAERKFLAGVSTQYESEVIYHKLKEHWNKLGIIFEDTDSAYQKYPELFKKYFGKAVPATDNKFAALNTAVWSGGSFIYVPKGVKIDIPLQTYFRINLKNMGQFERTLIIADEGSSIHYIEGCTAPMYSSDSLHSAVVEVFVEKEARVRYTTIQNWSTNVYNLVTKRSIVKENGIMEWIDCNLGSKITMKYPSIYLVGKKAHGEVLSMALAGQNQHLDAGSKMVHSAPNTSSIITSKSICKNGGRTSYRGLVSILKGATGAKSKVNCDAMILDDISRTDTYPTNICDEESATIAHEATVSKVDEDQLAYLMSRGLSKEEANSLIISGFIEPIVKDLPMEYAMEMNLLIKMNMEGSVG